MTVCVDVAGHVTLQVVLLAEHILTFQTLKKKITFILTLFLNCNVYFCIYYLEMFFLVVNISKMSLQVGGY